MFGLELSVIWLIIGIIFIALEMVTTALVSVWFVAGSLAGLLTSFVTDSFLIQIAVFLAVSIASMVVARPLLEKKLLHKEPTNLDMIIGLSAIVESDITPILSGRVKIDGLSWKAESNVEIKKGSQCLIKEIKGVTLIVAPIN